MCCFSTLPSEKAFPHCVHTYGRSPVCTRILCVRIAPIWENALPQSGQTCGFSPVCTLVWLRSPPAVEKHWEQWVHWYGRSPVCVRMCCFRS
uniref:Uncharacterized protein n=1 Tax=Cyclopterus lumpus TaxID=8103 RepID=A0A8C3G2S5_CYCLU